jgi:hypothetical protein
LVVIVVSNLQLLTTTAQRAAGDSPTQPLTPLLA